MHLPRMMQALHKTHALAASNSVARISSKEQSEQTYQNAYFHQLHISCMTWSSSLTPHAHAKQCTGGTTHPAAAHGSARLWSRKQKDLIFDKSL
jgi:hypothetical protein